MTNFEKGKAHARYEKLVPEREPYIDRAIINSQLTLPRLFVEDDFTPEQEFKGPWQGQGALGLKSLTSTSVITLFPPTRPFLRSVVDWSTAKKEGEVTDELRGEFENALADLDKQVSDRVYRKASRQQRFELFNQLYVGGNCVLYYPQEGKSRLYYLREYVCKRKRDGTLKLLIIREPVDKDDPPVGLGPFKEEDTEEVPGQDHDHLYTVVCLNDNGGYDSWQEFDGQVVADSQFTYTDKKPLPWIVARCNTIDGEHYGRSLIEDHIGDLATLDSLSCAFQCTALAMAKTIIGVKPGSTINKEDLKKATMSIIDADLEEDVTTLGLDKHADLRVVQEAMTELRQHLAYVFNMRQAIRRNAERVTAEEIRYMAQELEATNGGLYSVLASELQLPLAELELHYMEQEDLLPKLPEGIVNPTIVTGLDAIGRGQDFQDLSLLLNTLTQLFGPDFVNEHFKSVEAITRLAAGLNINTKGLVITQEELDQARAARAEEAEANLMVEKAGPALVKAKVDSDQPIE